MLARILRTFSRVPEFVIPRKTKGPSNRSASQSKDRMPKTTTIKTTPQRGGLLLGYNPRDAGQRLKTPAFTLFRPDCH